MSSGKKNVCIFSVHVVQNRADVRRAGVYAGVPACAQVQMLFVCWVWCIWFVCPMLAQSNMIDYNASS